MDEQGMVIAGIKNPFDDRKVAREMILETGSTRD